MKRNQNHTTMSNTEEVKELHLVKRGDLYKIPVSALVEEEGFNVREDYGDLESLALSIEESGVINPIHVYKKNDKWVLIDGHRRYRAAKIVEARTGTVIYIPAVLANAKTTSKEERCLDLILTNDGKHLEPYEEAEVYKRLVSYGWTASKIAKKVGKSDTYVGNLLTFTTVATEIKDMVKEGKLSTSLVTDTIKANGSVEAGEEALKDAVAKSEGKPVKRETVKNLDKKVSLAKLSNIISSLEEEKGQNSIFTLAAKAIYAHMSGSLGLSECIELITLTEGEAE